MDIKVRLNRVQEKLGEKRGQNPILILDVGKEDIEQKRQEFEKIYGKDYDTIIIRYGESDSIT